VYNIAIKRSFLRSKKFGRETNFAWQNSEAVVSNPLSPVKYVFRYERSGVRKTCVRRVKFPFPINSTVRSVYVRSTGGVQFYLARSAFKNIHQGEFFLSKAKPLLVNTFRGVPFNQCEQSEPSRTSI
jgi:hypothetical protein